MKFAYRLLAVAALLIPAASPSAAPLCVTSTSDLAIALQQAASTPLDIQVAKGTYRLDLTPWGLAADYNGVAASGTTLTGGYSPDCSTRDIDPSSTVLEDDGTHHMYQLSLGGDLTIDGFKFKLTGGLFVFGSEFATSDSTVVIRHVEFGGSSNDPRLNVLWYGSPDTNGTVRVVDALFHGSGNGWCGLGAQAELGNVAYYIVNVTSENNGYGICTLDDTASERASFYVYNSIAYNNTDADLLTSLPYVTLVDDQIGIIQKPVDPLYPAPIGLHSADPQLNSSYVPIAPASPVIDTGTSIVPGGLAATDIIGNPRVTGGGVDRGAYESLYDSSTEQLVKNTNDSGPDSLRTAIHNANLTAGKNTIKFQIGSDCAQVKIIAIDSNLEDIGGDTIIDGYTQFDALRNNLPVGDNANICIVLEPSASSTATHGLEVASGAADGVNVTIRGLAIGGFTGNGITLLGGSGHDISGNHFGGSVGGHALAANGVNIRIGAGVHDVVIGGDDDGQRNLIGGATNSGIYVAGGATPAHDNQIVNNYIGLGYGTDFVDRGNGTNGIYLAGGNNTISGNLIGHSGDDGIDVDNTAATGNTITHNSIGGNDANDTFGNGLAGVRVENGASGNTIYSNTVAHNTNDGIHVVAGVHNTIRKNSIFANGQLGIDIFEAGPSAAENFAGKVLFLPALSSAGGGHSSGRVTVNLIADAGDYVVDFYTQNACDSSGYGEGRQWLHATTVTIPASNQEIYTDSVDVAYPDTLTGNYITATMTDSAGDTTEFSACAAYTDDAIFSWDFDHPAP